MKKIGLFLVVLYLISSNILAQNITQTVKGKIVDKESQITLPGANIVVLGFSTALAIGISGLWGAFLSEEAERKKKIIDLKKDMVLLDELEDDDYIDELEKEKLELAKKMLEEKEIEKAMVIPIEIDDSKKKKNIIIPILKRDKKPKNNKTLIEQAENFATIIASLVDGGAPALGSTLPLIPFFFGSELVLLHFIFSYFILAGLLVYLGVFLGNISGQGRIKYALHLVTAGIVTLIVSLLLCQSASSCKSQVPSYS